MRFRNASNQRIRVGNERLNDSECCCGTPYTCSDGIGGVNEFIVELDVSGVADGATCTACENWNGVYEIDGAGFTPQDQSGDFCGYEYENECVAEGYFDDIFTIGQCSPMNNGDQTWRLFWLELSGGNTTLVLEIGQERDGEVGTGQVYAQWIRDFIGPPLFPVTFNNDHFQGATCMTLTATTRCDFSNAVIVATITGTP